MTKAKIRIGTRQSRLALVQAEMVKRELINKCGIAENEIEIVKIITTGDKIQDRKLNDIGGKGLFTKEIEEALINNEIDIAVHSLKDMPAGLPNGLEISAVLKREDARDTLVSGYKTFEELPKGSVVATSSLRRQAQLLAKRPDLRIVPIRGNVETRIEKLKKENIAATVLAMAGLKRLGLEKGYNPISLDDMLPAICQGIIGIESREGDRDINSYLKEINHQPSFVISQCERAFLEVMEGNCQTPLAAYAEIKGETISLKALVASEDGKKILRTEHSAEIKNAINIGKQAGAELKGQFKTIC